MHSDAIGWTSSGTVRLLDQTWLPGETRYVDIDTISGMVEAIQSLRVRGAPLIGVAATMGVAAAAVTAESDGSLSAGKAATLDWLAAACDLMAQARPTAVNLGWAVQRLKRAAERRIDEVGDEEAGSVLTRALRTEAQYIWDEDAQMCQAMAEAGAPRLPKGSRILTHCNTGMLATGVGASQIRNVHCFLSVTESYKLFFRRKGND